MGENFSKIKMGSLFTTSDGETFKKTSDLTFEDMAGIEHYLDPFIEKKIGQKPVDAKPTVDTSARVVKSGETEEAPKASKKKSAKKSKKTSV